MSDETKLEEEEEEETFGRFPIRRELTELPRDLPGVGRRFTFYDGCEVTARVGHEIDETPLTRREDLWVGREIVATTLVGRYEAIVALDSEGLHWRAGRTTGNLEFDIDDRHCWTSSYAIMGGGQKDEPGCNESPRPSPDR